MSLLLITHYSACIVILTVILVVEQEKASFLSITLFFLPSDIVLAVEDLLQQRDHAKRADKNEAQRSISQQIAPSRRIRVSHPSAR